jgi:uncharacterized protein YdcH (DUF465 family)
MSPKEAASKAAELTSDGTPEAPAYTKMALAPAEKGHFRRLVQQERSLAAQIKDLETILKTVRTDLGGFMIRFDSKSVMMDTCRVTLVQSETKTLKKEKLLEQGVTIDQIEKATVVTPKVYVQVTETKKEK